MALFGNRLAREIIMLMRQRYEELGNALGEACQQESLDQWNESSSLQHDLKLLIGVANGEYHRTEETVRRAEQALTRLLDLLLGNPLASRIAIPDDFGKTDLGILISRVRWWISVDDLITISNTAALVFGENTQANRMRIGRAGFLEWVPDPSFGQPLTESACTPASGGAFA